MKTAMFYILCCISFLPGLAENAYSKNPNIPVIVETYSEAFEDYQIDKPYRWSMLGDPSDLVVNKVEGYIGIKNPKNGHYGWVSPRVGKGGGITHDINHSIYHRKNPESFPKSYRLELIVQTGLHNKDDYFTVKLKWYNGENVIKETEYKINKEYPRWTSLKYKDLVPQGAKEYQITFTGPPGPKEAEDFYLLVDYLSMKILIEDRPVDFPTEEQLRRFKVDFPLNVREFHVWWHTPWHPTDWTQMYAIDPDNRTPFADLWDKRAWYVKKDYWQRDISSRQYPLLGPYDSFDREVIKWQVQTMKNTGLDGAFINLWPNPGQNMMDYGSTSVIFDRIINAAENCDFQVALYDENWEKDIIANAARMVMLLRKYIGRKGYYRINGQPAVWMQNWNRYYPYTPEELKQLITYVERQLGTDLYWVISLIRLNFPIEERYKEFLKIEQIDCVDLRYAVEEIAKNHSTGEISWFAMQEGLNEFISYLKSSPVKHEWSASVSPGFDSVDDYTRVPQVLYDGYIMPYQQRDHGLTFLKELYLISQQEIPPAFVTIKSWNDYHEGHAIEPGYYYEGDGDSPFGLSNDPYFYTKLVATVLSKKFTPAQLPPADHIDPLIRPLLYEEYSANDVYGPLFTELEINDDKFYCRIKDYHSRESRLVQDELPAAGFIIIDSGEVRQWGLEIANLDWLMNNHKVTENADQHCVKVYDKEKIQLRIDNVLAQSLTVDSRLFMVLSYFDLKTGTERYSSINFDYMANEGEVVTDRRIRVYNNAIWQWGIQCLYNADLKAGNLLEISCPGSELLIHSLYLVIPGMSKKSHQLKPLAGGQYALELKQSGQALAPDNIVILYPHDEHENYGNLIVVDTKNRKIIPDLKSLVTNK